MEVKLLRQKGWIVLKAVFKKCQKIVFKSLKSDLRDLIRNEKLEFNEWYYTGKINKVETVNININKVSITK